jgi:hypothetical protein
MGKLSLGEKSGLIMRLRNWSEEAWMDDGNAPPMRRMPEGQTLLDDGSIVFEEFEEGDPRRGPHTLSVQNDAAVHACARSRWHQRKRSVDWFAIRLAVGRGVPLEEVSRMFGVCRPHIGERRRLQKWVKPMTESDRRELSVLVWLAGVRRIGLGDHKSREVLKKTSEWRRYSETNAIWREKDREGEPFEFTINSEIPDDAYFSGADPKRDERRDAVDRLEARLRGLEAQWEEELEADEVAEGEGAGDRDQADQASADVGAVAGGLGESLGNKEGVAGVGASGAVTA